MVLFTTPLVLEWGLVSVATQAILIRICWMNEKELQKTGSAILYSED